MKEYLTEEELKRLIRRIEDQDPYAPRYMKEQILEKAFSDAGGRREALWTFSYRLKMIAGMAAALVMLTVIPFLHDEGSARRTPEIAVTEKVHDRNRSFREQTRKINQKFNVWFEQVNSFSLEHLFYEENGGMEHEN